MAFTCFLFAEPGLHYSRSFSQTGKDEKSKRREGVEGGEVVVMEYGGCGHRHRGGLEG